MQTIATILTLKTNVAPADRNLVADVLRKELLSQNLDPSYVDESGIEIVKCDNVTYHTGVLDNFVEKRSIEEHSVPNKAGHPLGTKSITDFDPWSYSLRAKREFSDTEVQHEIADSHHAKACRTCSQSGKIRCNICRGAGEYACSSCKGRGERACSSCSGHGEKKCWTCNGSGVKKTGYGQDAKTERCWSCAGSGKTHCDNCTNGSVTCNSCNGYGKVECRKCWGSGDVTCDDCAGQSSLDHFYLVKSRFQTVSQTHVLTSPTPGFDPAKANEAEFLNQKNVMTLKEARFSPASFDPIRSHPLHQTMVSTFDVKDTKDSRLVASRYTVVEHAYVEVVFSFFNETYTIYFDPEFKHSYYPGRKPSDQYDLDLLQHALTSVAANDLPATRSALEKLAKSDYVELDTDRLLKAIDDTGKMYEATNYLGRWKFLRAESLFANLSEDKKRDIDFKQLCIQHFRKSQIILSPLYLFFGCLIIYHSIPSQIPINLLVFAFLSAFSIGLSYYVRSIIISIFYSILLLTIHFSVIYVASDQKEQLANDYSAYRQSNTRIGLISFNEEDSDNKESASIRNVIVISESDHNYRYLLPKGSSYYTLNSYGDKIYRIIDEDLLVTSDSSIPTDDVVKVYHFSNSFYVYKSSLAKINTVLITYIYDTIDSYTYYAETDCHTASVVVLEDLRRAKNGENSLVRVVEDYNTWIKSCI